MVEIDWPESLDDKTIAAAAEMVSGFEREVIPGEPDTPAAELAADLANVPPHRHISIGMASDAGQPVGTVRLVLSDTEGNQDLAEVEYLIVRPERRGAGIGRALVDAVGERTERPRIRAYVPVGHSGGMGLAAAVGATPGIVERQNRLRIADLDRQMLEGWVRQAADRAHDYSLVCFDGPCPDELLEGFAALSQVMNTAPRSAGDQDVLPTPAEVRADHQALSAGWAGCGRCAPATTPPGRWWGSRSSWPPGPGPGSANSGTPRWTRRIATSGSAAG